MANPRKKTGSPKKIKKGIALSVMFVLLGVGLFTACNSSNDAPTQPFAGGLPKTPTNSPTGTVTSLTTPTFTGTLPTSTPTSTNTPTGIINTNTPTLSPTITWTPADTPAFAHNYGTSAAPNGMYYDGTTVYVAEAESKGGSVVNALENFTNSGGGALAFNGTGNCIVQGQATLCPTFQPTPYSLVCNIVSFPIGVAVSNPVGTVNWSGGVVPNGFYPGEVEILDLQTSGSATLYAENNYTFCPPAGDGGPYMDNTTGFGGASFNNPKALTADSAGHFYVADTGNGYIDEFDGGGYLPPSSPAWLHRWNGSGGGFGPSVQFKNPNSVACDTLGNVYVGDSGPFVVGGVSTSMVEIYSSGGTTILGAFTLISGCVVNGITVDNTGDFYVSDTSNGEVEEYQIIDASGVTPAPWPPPAGTVYTQVGLRRAWGDPHSYHELQPYTPSCLQFIGSYIVVGDSGNDFLNTFGPGLP